MSPSLDNGRAELKMLLLVGRVREDLDVAIRQHDGHGDYLIRDGAHLAMGAWETKCLHVRFGLGDTRVRNNKKKIPQLTVAATADQTTIARMVEGIIMRTSNSKKEK